MPLPHPDAWPFILVSALFQFAYFQLVAAAYRAGDIGLVYPLMRGVAPLLVAATSGAIIGESLSSGALAGVLTISTGVLTLAFEARKGGKHAILLALANAVVIASYTYVDGIGARLALNPISYTLWMALLPPVLLFSWAFAKRGVCAVAAPRPPSMVARADRRRRLDRRLWPGALGDDEGTGRNGRGAARNLDPVCHRHLDRLPQGTGQHLPHRRRLPDRTRGADAEAGLSAVNRHLILLPLRRPLAENRIDPLFRIGLEHILHHDTGRKIIGLGDAHLRLLIERTLADLQRLR